MKKKRNPLPDLETIRAAREAIKQERELRRAGEVTHFITGVPKPADWGNWPDAPPKPQPLRVPPSTAKPTVPIEPARLPVEWHYVCVQTAPPSDRNPQGVIAEAYYGVRDNVVYVEDVRGEPLGSQQVRSDDNPAGVARRILKDRRNKGSRVPGFYDSISNNGKRVFH
jgi:hypothetical protein